MSYEIVWTVTQRERFRRFAELWYSEKEGGLPVEAASLAAARVMRRVEEEIDLWPAFLRPSC